MKFAHISDLHLGISLLNTDLYEDQKYILDEIVDIAVKNNVDAILISGDIYDVSVPQVSATILFSEFITKLSRQNIRIYIIAGNHDDARRLSFASEILEKSNIFIAKSYEKDIKPLVLDDEYGKVFIYMLPFMKPIHIKNKFLVECKTYDEAIKLAIENLNVDYSERNIILSHQFINGASICDSENILQVGNIDNVSYEYYKNFDYVALGHLHTPQCIKDNEHIRYSGSPIKLSFSEAHIDKTMPIVELKEKGTISINLVPLIPLHNMSIVSGTYDTLSDKTIENKKYENDYLKIILNDEQETPYAKERLKSFYKNLLELRYVKKNVDACISSLDEEAKSSIKRKTDIELINDFFNKQMGHDLNEVQKEIVHKILEEENETIDS